LPIAEKYEWDKPFLGAILAGIFTRGSLDQLRSVGFHVLYFPHDNIVAAFNHVGIDVRFDESTPDTEFRACVEAIDALAPEEILSLTDLLVSESSVLIDSFLSALQQALDRMIERLVVIPMFGYEHEFESIEGAVDCIENLDEAEGGGDFRKYEVIARFSNGDSIAGSFKSKSEALRFLRYLAG
jgi:predicted RecB family endonuclease